MELKLPNMKKLLLLILLLPTFSFGQGPNGKDISNRPSGGSISVDTVNALSKFNLRQTTAGQTISVANLTTAGKTIEVRNKGTVRVTMSPGGVLDTGKFFMYAWMGNKWAVSAGGGGSWGSITGTLSSQADLQTALNAKLDSLNPEANGTLYFNGPGYIDNSTLDVLSIGTQSNTQGVNIGRTGANVSFPGLTPSTVPYIDASYHLISSAITPTELARLSGVTSNVQTQLNGKQASSANLTKWALKDTVYATSTRPGQLSSSDWNTFNGKASTASVSAKRDSALAAGKIVIGQSYGGGLAVTPSGDATISNAGVITNANTAVTPGSYTSTNLTVDSKGRITAASNGSGSSYTGSNGIDVTGTTISLKSGLKTDGTGIIPMLRQRFLYNMATPASGINWHVDYFGNLSWKRSDGLYRTLGQANQTDLDFALVPVGSTLYDYGDSFTAGASSGTTAGACYSLMLNQELGTVRSDLATAQRGYYQGVVNGYTNITAPAQGAATCLLGLNDIRKGGASFKTISKMQCGLRALLANHFLVTIIPASSGTVTKAGTWTATSGIGDKASLNLGGTVQKSIVNGSTLTWTTPAGASVIAIGTFVSDEVTTNIGTFTYSVDGGTPITYDGRGKTDGISDGFNNNALTQDVILISGLTATAHTIVITSVGTTQVLIDYFGVFNNPQSCPPFIVGSIPKLSTYGYAQIPSSATATISNSADSAIRTVIAETAFLQFPVHWVDVNEPGYYSMGGGDISADSIHPSNTGHMHIYRKFLTKIRSASSFTGQTFSQIPVISGTNKSYFLQNGTTGWILSANRDAVGNIINSSLPAAQIACILGSADSKITFTTGATNGAVGTNITTIDKSGKLWVQMTPLASLGAYINARQSVASGASFNVAMGGTDPTSPQPGDMWGSGTRNLKVSCNILFNAVGDGLQFKSGTNARMGTATLVGGTVTVANTSVTALTEVIYSVKTAGGTQGFLSTTKVNGTSFTITSTSASDTSIITWELRELN